MSSPLRTQFINHLTLHRHPKQKRPISAAVYGLTRHYMTSPDKLSDKQIQDYLKYLSDILLKNTNLPGAPVM